jgi:hypothetical protein
MLRMLNFASRSTFELSTLIAIFSHNKNLTPITSLKRVLGVSRIDLLATTTEQYIWRAVLSCGGVG